MLHLNSATAYYWYNGAAHMRKGFDALCGIVQQHMHANIVQGGVYIFVNRKLNCLHGKAMAWRFITSGLKKAYMNFPPSLPVAPLLPSMPCNCN